MTTSCSRLLSAALLTGGLFACKDGGGPPPPPPVTSVVVNPPSVPLTGIGITAQITASALGSRGQGLTNVAFEWLSNNTAVATVSGSGASATVTSVSPGTAQITATATPSGVSGSTSVVVTANLQSVTTSASSVVLDFGANRTRQLTASARADTGVNVAYTWTSLDPSKVTVSPTTGTSTTLTAVGGGATTVRVTVQAFGQSRTADVAVTVIAVVRSVSISPPAANLPVGESTTLTAAVEADPGVSREVEWSSSAPSLATVNASGTVTAVARGTVVITAVSRVNPLASGSSTIQVDPVGRSVNVDPDSVSLTIGSQTTLTATVLGEPSFARTVSWTSRNPSVASVDASGQVSATALGQTFVIATATGDPAVKDSARFTVRPKGGTVSSWRTIKAPDLPGLGSRWFDLVQDVAYTPTGQLVVIAENGTVYLRNSGDQFARTTLSFASPQLFQASPQSLYVLGLNGLVDQWVAGRFTPLNTTPLPSGGAVLDLWVAPTGDVFASGSNAGAGVVRRLSGGQWTSMTLPTGVRSLRAIWGTSASDLVAAGDGAVSLVRYNGVTWSQVQGLPNVATVYDIWSAGDGNYYLAAATGAYRLTGTTLTQISTASTLRVRGTAPDDVVFAEQFQLLRWNGTSMQVAVARAEIGSYSYQLRTFDVSASEFAFGSLWGIVSAQPRSGNATAKVLAMNPAFNDVAVTSQTHAVAVGEWGQVARLNGSTWTGEILPGYDEARRVASLGPTQTWATTAQGIYFSDGPTWRQVFAANDGKGFVGIWAGSPSNVWAVGSAGKVARFDGTSWSLQTVSTADLYAVWGSAPGDVFVGGDNGVVLRFNGTTFSPTTTNTTQRIWRIHGSTANDVYAYAQHGLYLRLAGSTWTQFGPAQGPVAGDFWSNGQNDVYAAAQCVWQFDGTSWQQLDCPGSIQAIDGLSAGGAVAVGTAGRLWLGRNSQSGFSRRHGVIVGGALQPLQAGSRFYRNPVSDTTVLRRLRGSIDVPYRR